MIMTLNFKSISPVYTCTKCKRLLNPKMIEGEVIIRDGRIREKIIELKCECGEEKNLVLHFSADIRSK